MVPNTKVKCLAFFTHKVNFLLIPDFGVGSQIVTSLVGSELG